MRPRLRSARSVFDTRVVVEPLHVAHGHEVLEVPVPLGVAGEKDEVVSAALGLVRPVARGHVRLAAEDRLHARGDRLLVEIDRAEHVAVIGDRHRGHAELAHPRDEILKAHRAVEERVLAVEVEVDEGGAGRHALRYLKRGAACQP
jgi:hypothetical protein